MEFYLSNASICDNQKTNQTKIPVRFLEAVLLLQHLQTWSYKVKEQHNSELGKQG
jgi:hypothetical protein